MASWDRILQACGPSEASLSSIRARSSCTLKGLKYSVMPTAEIVSRCIPQHYGLWLLFLRWAGCCFAYIQIILAFALLLNAVCLLKCNSLPLHNIVRYVMSISEHYNLITFPSRTGKSNFPFYTDVFLNKIVSPYKVLKVSQIPSSFFFIIYTNHPIISEGSGNRSSHSFFQSPAHHSKKIKSTSTFFLLWALKKIPQNMNF